MRFILNLISLAFDFDSHATGSALNHANSLINAASVKVCHFLFGDVFALVKGDLCNFCLVRNTTALCDSGCLLQQGSSRWAFGDKVKATIVVDSDDDRDGSPTIFLGAVIKGLDELSKVHAVLTK